MRNQCLIPADQARFYQKAFEHVDSDSDGYITRDELDVALKAVNRSLLQDKHTVYIHALLDLEPDAVYDLRTFSVIAALSRRVAGLEAVVWGLVDGMNAEALRLKLQRSKELFYLLDEQHQGVIAVEDLMIELRSGGLTREHERLLLDQFVNKGNGVVEFLDFLTHIPLFVEIHQHICGNPLDFVSSSV